MSNLMLKTNHLLKINHCEPAQSVSCREQIAMETFNFNVCQNTCVLILCSAAKRSTRNDINPVNGRIHYEVKRWSCLFISREAIFVEIAFRLILRKEYILHMCVYVITGTPTSHCRNSEKVRTADEHTKLINNSQTVHRITPETANSLENYFL